MIPVIHHTGKIPLLVPMLAKAFQLCDCPFQMRSITVAKQVTHQSQTPMKSSFELKDFLFLFKYICMYLCEFMCTTCVQALTESRGYHIPKNRSYRWLGGPRCGCWGTEPLSSE